jgi:hypothetical protein
MSPPAGPRATHPQITGETPNQTNHQTCTAAQTAMHGQSPPRRSPSLHHRPSQPTTRPQTGTHANSRQRSPASAPQGTRTPQDRRTCPTRTRRTPHTPTTDPANQPRSPQTHNHLAAKPPNPEPDKKSDDSTNPGDNQQPPPQASHARPAGRTSASGVLLRVSDDHGKTTGVPSQEIETDMEVRDVKWSRRMDLEARVLRLSMWVTRAGQRGPVSIFVIDA